MFVIIVYDVQSSRSGKLRKKLRQYLNWKQNSVFDGDITASELEYIHDFIQGYVRDDEQVIVYEIDGSDFVKETVFGQEVVDKQFL